MNAYAQLLALLDAGQPACAVVVLSAEGSTPREAGVRAVVDAAGQAYAQAADCLAARRRGVLLTTVRPAPQVSTNVRWVAEGDLGELPRAAVARECLVGQRPALLPAEDGETLVEPVVPDPLLVIAGGGHIGQALARQALLIGFAVRVLDDRPEFSDAARFPAEAETQCGDVAAALAAVPATDDTYIVIVTRGHEHDAEALRACIGRPFAYVGMIGSRRKVALLRQDFIEAGLATAEQFDAVFAPVGLDIGAETVPEIATSISAELIAVRSRGASDRRPRHMRSR
jgi:xanthine dehydrogenase accessory factor